MTLVLLALLLNVVLRRARHAQRIRRLQQLDTQIRIWDHEQGDSSV
jgi:hypothetical protein